MIALAGFPFAGPIIAGTVMIAAGASRRRMGGPAGRFAAGACPCPSGF